MKLFSLFVILSSALVLSKAHGLSEAPKRCLKSHLKDAIELNRKRAPFYELLSQGRSREITKRLIAMEKSLLMAAPIGDWFGKFFQKKDIPVLCLDLVDMSETPAMRGFNPEGVDRNFLYSRPPVEQWNYQLDLALLRSDYEIASIQLPSQTYA